MIKWEEAEYIPASKVVDEFLNTQPTGFVTIRGQYETTEFYKSIEVVYNGHKQRYTKN